MTKPSSKKIGIRVLVFTIYMLAGGAIFQLLEKENQQMLINNYKITLNKFVKKYNITQKDLLNLEEIIVHSKAHSGSPRWSFENSVFFAGSAILTVGYGNIVPRTTPGKAFCIIYALIGIPLACLALKSLGERMMDMQISLIRKLYAIFLNNRHVNSVHLKASILNFFLTVLVVLLFSGMTLLKRKDWSYFEGIYFVFITFTTIGFGDYVPVYEKGFSEFDVVSIVLAVFIGFSLVSSLLCSVSAALEEYSVKKVIKKARKTIVKKRGRCSRVISTETGSRVGRQRSTAIANECIEHDEICSTDDLRVTLQAMTFKRGSIQILKETIAMEQRPTNADS